jgi:hypothetical protein
MEEMKKEGFQSLATNDAASDAATGVTGGLGVIVTATAKIVLASVANNGTANDRVRTVKLDHLVDESILATPSLSAVMLPRSPW